MIIEEISEDNFSENVRKGELVVQQKLTEIDELFDFEQRKNLRNRVADIDWKRFYDPTVWAYKSLLNEKKESLILRSFQDKIINDKNQFIVVTAANQIGKTVTAAVKAIHHAIMIPNATVLIVSRSDRQAIKILDDIKWFMRNSNIKFDTVIGDIENRTELHLLNDSKIICFPPTKGVLAFPATLIICDEIGFWEVDNMDQIEYFEQVIVSRIQETQDWKNEHFTMGQIFCISSPNAQQGVLWYLWNNKNYNQYRYCWLSKSGRTLEQYNRIRAELPSDIFDKVYAAVFSSATGGFITQVEFNDAVRDYSVFVPPEQLVCLGGDFAGEDTKSRDVDETVLMGGVKIKEDGIEKVKIVYLSNFPLRIKKHIVYDEIKKIGNIQQFAYDKVGVGDSVKNDLIEQNVLSEYQIESLTYSLPNKSEVYYNMKRLFEQRRIILPNHPKLKEQLLGLRFEKTEGGHIKVHHAREGIHDDWADAFANCLWATMRSSAVPVDLTFVSHNKKSLVKIEEKRKNRGELIYCQKCEDYHWESEEHLGQV
tara:strand:+ start:1327 stop:2940 length:1614 start_codon:yes stop_codon:yes gene_type:complete